MRETFVFSAMLLAACGPGAAEQEAQRQRDVAQVEASMDAPPEPLVLEPITFADVERENLFGAGCNVLPADEDASGIAIVLAHDDAAYFKRDGEFVRLSADTGSAELPYMARQKYSGLAFSLELELEGEGEQSGYETTDYRSVLTVRDDHDREVLVQRGVTQCGA